MGVPAGDVPIIRKFKDNVKCPCCGASTGRESEIYDPEDGDRVIITCDVNGCIFYLTEYLDGTTVFEPKL